MINWDCNLDYDAKHCLPKYSFHRLDDAENTVAEGVNFRCHFSFSLVCGQAGEV